MGKSLIFFASMYDNGVVVRAGLIPTFTVPISSKKGGMTASTVSVDRVDVVNLNDRAA